MLNFLVFSQPWQDIPFAAANFSSSSGSWVVASGSVLTNQWAQLGPNIVLYNLFYTVGVSEITGTPAQLFIKNFPFVIAKKFMVDFVWAGAANVPGFVMRNDPSTNSIVLQSQAAVDFSGLLTLGVQVTLSI